MNILGVSCFYHDSAAALLQDGALIAAMEEERLSRVKHDYGFPARAIQFCLQQAGIRGSDLDYVVFYEKPLVKFERILLTALGTYPRSWRTFGEAMISWFDEKLWVKNRLMREIGVPAEKVLFVDHHMAHAASSFFCSPFDESAILTIDGVGEWTTATMGTAKADWDGNGKNEITLSHELKFPHSLGLLYSAFTAFLGFEVNEGEYKVMGMAPYGEPRYQDKIHKLLRLQKDGSFQLNMEYFSYHYSDDRTFSNRFVSLFGEPRDPDSEFRTARTHANASAQDAGVKQNQYYADIAASIQLVTEEIILKMANHLHDQTGLKKLCVAGGVALNSVANGRILRETPFEDLFIHPAAGDSGGAVGAALYAWHVLLGKPRRFILEHAYWGQSFTEGEIQDFVRTNGLAHKAYENEDALMDHVVSQILEGKVVGWFQGRSEWGPRALGNRSILADPRRADMKEIVNSKIKFREPFRPFAPVVLEEQAAKFFDGLPDFTRPYPARFMLLVMPWKGTSGESIPAVNHMGTGRLQTLRREWNPRYYGLIEKFGEATGIPVLLNTSFNLRGEPIVSSPRDAWNTFSKSGIDLLVLGNVLLSKNPL
jgi:carbamoyltransferase